MDQPKCPVCEKLTTQYEQAERQYGQAIFMLSARRESAAREDYMRLRLAADDARMESETARLELEQHKRVHSSAN